MAPSIFRRLRSDGTAGFILVAVAVLLADQATKLLVRAALAACSAAPCDHLRLGPLARVNTANPVGAFNVGSGASVRFVATTLLALVLVPVYGGRLARAGVGGWQAPLALGLVAGGALGNLVDRIGAGAVTDFLYVPPAFVLNVADVAVIAGTALSVRLLLKTRERLAAPALG